MAGDFQDYMRAAGARLDVPTAPCPTHEELMEYHLGSLGVARTEHVQSHLMHCNSCRETLASLPSEPTLEATPTTRGVDVSGEWTRLAARIGREERTGSKRHVHMLMAAAAAIVLAFGLTLGWAVKLQQSVTEERSARQNLEQQNRQLQAKLSVFAPTVNFAVYDVLPEDVVARSGREAPAITIRSSPGEPFALLLNGTGQEEFPDYALEIAGLAQRPVWNIAGVRRDGNRNYTILIPARFLSPGAYVLKVFGMRGPERKHLGSYKIQLN